EGADPTAQKIGHCLNSPTPTGPADSSGNSCRCQHGEKGGLQPLPTPDPLPPPSPAPHAAECSPAQLNRPPAALPHRFINPLLTAAADWEPLPLWSPGGQRRGKRSPEAPVCPQRPHAVLPPSPQGSSLPPSSLSLWKVHRSPESPSRCDLAPHSRGFSRHRRLPTLALPRRKGDEKAPGLNPGYKLCFLGFREPGGQSESRRRLPGRGGGRLRR
ncbi:unnamed protein product, partial [Gulo gulo]